MNIDIKTLGFRLTRGLRDHVVARLGASLGRFDERELQVIVCLADLNGSGGGVDKQCRLMLRIGNAPSVDVRDTREDIYVAVERAAERAEHVLARRVQRSQRMTDRRSASGEAT